MGLFVRKSNKNRWLINVYLFSIQEEHPLRLITIITYAEVIKITKANNIVNGLQFSPTREPDTSCPKTRSMTGKRP